MATTTEQALLFELSGEGIQIGLETDDHGGVLRLAYRARDEARDFSGDEIAGAASDEGTRASVLLESGAADGPIVRLSVVVPTVILGEEHSYEVTAAAVRSTQRSLFGGPRPGPQQSYEAFALSGTASPARGAAPGTCRHWYASHDHMPPRPATLRVTGVCTFPTGGYSVELRRHEPQGINHRDLLLDKVVTEPTGPVPDVITDVEVRYEEVTDVDYDTVTILPDGPTIPVEDVH